MHETVCRFKGVASQFSMSNTRMPNFVQKFYHQLLLLSFLVSAVRIRCERSVIRSHLNIPYLIARITFTYKSFLSRPFHNTPVISERSPIAVNLSNHIRGRSLIKFQKISLHRSFYSKPLIESHGKRCQVRQTSASRDSYSSTLLNHELVSAVSKRRRWRQNQNHFHVSLASRASRFHNNSRSKKKRKTHSPQSQEKCHAHQLVEQNTRPDEACTRRRCGATSWWKWKVPSISWSRQYFPLYVYSTCQLQPAAVRLTDGRCSLHWMWRYV